MKLSKMLRRIRMAWNRLNYRAWMVDSTSYLVKILPSTGHFAWENLDILVQSQ